MKWPWAKPGSAETAELLRDEIARLVHEQIGELVREVTAELAAMAKRVDGLEQRVLSLTIDVWGKPRPTGDDPEP